MTYSINCFPKKIFFTFFSFFIFHFTSIFILQNLVYASRHIDSKACGRVTIDPTEYSMEEKIAILKGVCFTQKLIKEDPQYSPKIVWNDLYKANAENSCHGLTYQPAFSFKKKVFIFVSIPETERGLLGYNQLGSTVLHEFHHYWTGSHHNGGPSDPTEIYDNASLNAFRDAIFDEYKHPTLCKKDIPHSWIKNRVQKYACECNLKFWRDKDESQYFHSFQNI